jgi:hypothetical protein
VHSIFPGGGCLLSLSYFPHFCPFLILGFPTIWGPALGLWFHTSQRTLSLRPASHNGNGSGTVTSLFLPSWALHSQALLTTCCVRPQPRGEAWVKGRSLPWRRPGSWRGAGVWGCL